MRIKFPAGFREGNHIPTGRGILVLGPGAIADVDDAAAADLISVFGATPTDDEGAPEPKRIEDLEAIVARESEIAKNKAAADEHAAEKATISKKPFVPKRKR